MDGEHSSGAPVQVIFPRFRRQTHDAANAATCVLNSNSTGLRYPRYECRRAHRGSRGRSGAPIPAPACALAAPAGALKPAARDVEHVAEDGDGIEGLLRGDERELHALSFAKKAAVFGISRSI